MKDVKCIVLNVGGWFDAEDPVGPSTFTGPSRKIIWES
jgi:hypothetical protein